MKQAAFVLLLLMSTSTWAEWTYVGTTSELDAYADLTTVRKRGDIAKMWVLFDYKTTQQAPGVTFLSSVMQSEYECGEDQSWRIAFYTMYSGHLGDGIATSPQSHPDKWTPVPPGTVVEAFWKIACKQ